jgi:hypothetical protein
MCDSSRLQAAAIDTTQLDAQLFDSCCNAHTR